MVSLVKIALILGTSSALVLPRDGAKILADLKQINADYKALQAADAQFGLDGNATAVQAAVTKTDADNTLAFMDATLSLPLSRSDAQAIIDYVNNTLEPTVKTTNDESVAQKPSVEKQGLAPLVAAEILQQRVEFGNIANAIEAKTPDAQKPAVKAAFEKIEKVLDHGVEVYLS